MFPYRPEESDMFKTAGNRLFISLQIKFMILFMLLITIPFLISGALTYVKYSSNVERDAENYTSQIVEQIRINLDSYMKEIERLTLSPFYDSGILEILKNHSGPYLGGVYYTVEEQQKTNLFMSSMAFDRPETESILIFTNDGSLLNNSEASIMSYWMKDNENWMSKVSSEQGGLTILPPHTVYYYKSGPKRVVSLSRLIREPYTLKILGIIKIDLSADFFGKVFLPAGPGNKFNLYIYDKTGNQLYPTQVVSKPDMLAPGYLTTSTESRYTGLQILSQTPRDDLIKEANELISFTLMIVIFSLTVAYLLSILSSNSLIKPIRHLQSKMALVEKGFLKEQAVVTSHDEIGQMTEGFNKMAGEIYRLVREVYETKIREREAELSALQNQMNPHFLYNTLESINMMAVQSNNMELSNMVTNLGNLLRFTVDQRQPIVYLQEELKFVESYLQIQELRNGNKLRTEVHIDPSLQKALIPKLILQPLVENVIEHGMGVETVTVRLRAKMEDGDLLLSVDDDGLGMDEQTAMSVEERMYASKMEDQEKQEYGKKIHRYALRNVHQRVHLLYGEPYGVIIEKKSSRGTTFVIRLPFQWEE
jgi:two-component system sensor histidine kinase YesM